MQGEISHVTLLVTRALEANGIAHAVCGSLASSLHGIMRTTIDVNIVAEIKPEHVPLLAAALSGDFYIDPAMILSAIAHRSSFNLIHYGTAFKVDIFVSRERPFDHAQLDRRIVAAIATDPEQTVRIITPEDTILAKLEWYRLGNEVSDRQWRDILGVLKVCAGTLDMAYLHRWAASLQVSDLLERALQDAGIE